LIRQHFLIVSLVPHFLYFHIKSINMAQALREELPVLRETLQGLLAAVLDNKLRSERDALVKEIDNLNQDDDGGLMRLTDRITSFLVSRP
jgi:hypothetical protein